MPAPPPYVSSLFIAPPSLCLVGLVLFIALLNGQRELTTLALLVLAVAGLAKAWARASRAGLACRVSVDRVRVFPGEPITLRVDIENRRLLPVFVRVSPDAAGLVPPEPAAPLAAARGLLWYQRVAFRWTLTPGRRGVYALGRARLHGGDLLGFYASAADAGEPQEVLVYPRVVPLRRLALPRRDVFGVPGRESPVRDPVYILGTRDYQHGRPAKHIHWKASARHHRLQEKLFEPSEQEKVLLVVDVEGGAAAEAREPFERLLEAVASLAVQLDRRGLAVGLAANGTLIGGRTPLVRVGRSPRQMQAILELLARLTPTRSSTPLLDLVRVALPSGATCVCWSLDGGPAGRATAEYLASRRIPVRSLAVSPARDTDGRTESQQGIDALLVGKPGA